MGSCLTWSIYSSGGRPPYSPSPSTRTTSWTRATPTRVSVRGGTNFNDLQEIEVVDLTEPTGWIIIPLKDLNERLVRTFLLQIAVIQNHQQGRDTHPRQVKVHSPVTNKIVSSA